MAACPGPEAAVAVSPHPGGVTAICPQVGLAAGPGPDGNTAVSPAPHGATKVYPGAAPITARVLTLSLQGDMLLTVPWLCVLLLSVSWQ